MIPRTIEPTLKRYSRKFPAITIMGPRQSGKTTIARATFPNHTYISLEEIDLRQAAKEDPRGFLRNLTNEHGVILDEVQNVPSILSYIQSVIDEENKPGYFILTGSHNLLLNQAVSQTLAGRTAVITLLPLSINELKHSNLLPERLDELVWHGSYPRLFSNDLQPGEWYPSYIKTYLERDVRQLKNVTDLALFQKFLGLCAGRIGQLLNIASLANDCGITFATARGWLSLLEMSYIIVLLQPYHTNYSKRLVKSPKLYFLDTGLACSVLRIEKLSDFSNHYLRGGLVESFFISEFLKEYYNKARQPSLYFWRDNHGHEVDCLIDHAGTATPIEIKAGLTVNKDYFKGLSYWSSLTDTPPDKGYVIYGGDRNWQRKLGRVVSWKDAPNILAEIVQEKD